MIGRRRQADDGLTQTGGGKFWRLLVGVGLVGAGSWFLASIIASPSKRNLEALAGLVFMGFMASARPFAAYLFTIVLIPFPAQTSFASTSMMLIVALAILTSARSQIERLDSPLISRGQDLAIMSWGLFVALAFYDQNPVSLKVAIHYLLGLATAVILYYTTISLVNTESKLVRSLRISEYIAIVLAVLGILQWLFPDRQVLPQFFSFSRQVAENNEVIRRGEVRVMATFTGQELFAEYLALNLMLQYFFFRWARTVWTKSFWLAGMLVLLAALFATATRGALIILAGGFIYLIVIGGRVVPRTQLGKVVFVALAVFYLAAGFLEPLVSHMMERMSTIGVDDGSVQHRAVVLGEAFRGVVAQPFLGHGLATAPGTFRGAVSMNIHNLYLTTAYTIGVPGLIALLWFLVGLWRKGWSVIHDERLPTKTRELALVLHVMLVMFMVDQIKIEYVRQPLTMHLAWLHFAFVMVIWNLSRKYRGSEASG